MTEASSTTYSGPITIVVPAYRIDRKLLTDFVDRNGEVLAGSNARVVFVTEQQFQITGGDCLVFPRVQHRFSLAATCNYGIRSQVGLVVKADVDMVFSRLILSHIRSAVSRGTAFVGVCAYVDTVEETDPDLWAEQEKMFWAWGGCFAMLDEDWNRVSGYNEELWGHGGDDRDMVLRVSRAMNIELSSRFPLHHINHDPRRVRVSDAFFEDRGEINREIIGWQGTDWSSPDWGLGNLVH